MRIRRKPWARPELAASPFCVDRPEENRGNWKAAFPKVQPLELELGCGKGSFIAEKALQNLQRNLIAVDIKSDMLGLAKRRVEANYAKASKQVDNVRLFAYDIERILEVFSPEDVVDRIYINFCNPWPKKKHKKKRLTHPRQLAQYQKFLKKEGEIWFKTDDENLFEESLIYFGMRGFRQKYLTRDLANSGFQENVITEHEQMFMQEGISIKFAIFVNHAPEQKGWENMKAIVNGKIVLTDRIEDGKAVLFTEKISAIVPREEVPIDAEEIDAEGSYVLPGLFDIHIHGSGGADTMDASPEALDIIAQTIAKHGVTRFLPTSVTLPLDATGKVFELIRNRMNTPITKNNGAIIEGINMEGPFITAAYKGAHEENYIRACDFEFVKKYSDVIQLVTVAPEQEGGLEFVRKVSQETSVKVAIGHSAASYEQAKEAFANGASDVTHLFNAMTPLHHRKPGIVTAALDSPVYTEMICDTIHVHPALFDFVMGCKGEHFILITDCMRAGGMKAGNYRLGELEVVVDQSSARLTDGTLAGSILSLDQAIANVHQFTNRPLYEIVKAASLNPAKLIGIDDRIGSIEPGKVADFVIMDPNFKVQRTLIQGRTVYQG